VKATEVLLNHSLKRTGCREGIIGVILSAGHPLSEQEIKEHLGGTYDRTTFYRSFKTLEDHKIIHKIVVDEQVVRYALDNSVSNKNEHAHFFCNTCHALLCLEEPAPALIPLPAGFTTQETEIIIKGTCAGCKPV
jgi:Fur family ferric uptake transcriptional regulator